MENQTKPPNPLCGFCKRQLDGFMFRADRGQLLIVGSPADLVTAMCPFCRAVLGFIALPQEKK